MSANSGEPPKSATPRLSQLRPSNRAFYDDAAGVLRQVREASPVLRDEGAKVWLISGFDAARTILSDHSLWRGPEKGEPSIGRDQVLRDGFSRHPETGEPISYSITQMDDPDHARVRGLLAQPFYARVARFKPQLEAIVDEVLAGLDSREGFDLVADLAIPIPIKAIAVLLGVDSENWEPFREWSEGLNNFINAHRSPAQEAAFQNARTALIPFFLDQIEARRRAPKDDLISDYAARLPAGAQLSDAELLTNLMTFLTAGNVTTSDLIGNGVHLLLTHPGELEKLKADPSIVNRVIEEVLRYAPPLDITVRIASRDLEVGGCPLRKTQNLTVLLRAANRDPAQFEEPDRFDVSRPPRPHLAFGGGSHLCLGAPLARMEAQVTFAKLFARFPTLRLAAPGETPPRRMLPFVNGFEGYRVLV